MSSPDAIKGVGAATAAKLAESGINKAEEIPFLLPSAYIDLGLPRRVVDAEAGQFCLFEGVVYKVTAAARRGAKTFSVYLRDSSDRRGTPFKAVFFNQPYFHDKFQEGVKYRMLGKLSAEEAVLTNPVFEPADDIKKLKGVIGVYPLRGAIGQTAFKKFVSAAIDKIETECRGAADYLTPVLRSAHFPESVAAAESAVRKLAAYDAAVGINIYRNSVARGDSARRVFYNLPENIILEFENLIDVTPTETQRAAFREIADDLNSPCKMSRIICGDVGSGKTLTAFFAAYAAARAGLQCAVMAPTEILAEQHASKFAAIAAKAGIEYRLITASSPAAIKKSAAEDAEKGRASVFFGTQALLSAGMNYARLALAVIDEQHKFGVKERAELQNKGAQDVLTLTATPIPRSLALTVYDDISLSFIRKRPEAATRTVTKIVTDAKLPDMLKYVASECSKGKQAFIVCPAIRDCEGYEILSVETFLRDYTDIFAGVGLSVIHGRMSAAEKESAMSAFSRGKTDAIVATTVIEVGVDTKASVMCVLNADRFGLASLHQLRGRVGRDGGESYCFLHTSLKSVKAADRLKILCECADGTEIAERDFAMRGAGDLLGTRQSGAARTPCMGLPLTPDVLKDAAALTANETECVKESLIYCLGVEKYGAFAEKLAQITLDS